MSDRIRRNRRYENKVAEGNFFWEMEFDLSSRSVYVYMRDGEVGERVASADEKSIADIAFGADDLPIVLGVEILDENKTSILLDWIEDAIEASLENLNVFRSDDFADDYHKGVMIQDHEEVDVRGVREPPTMESDEAAINQGSDRSVGVDDGSTL